MRTPRKYKIAPWARPDSEFSNKSNRPAIYHCVSRVVDRRFIFHAEEKEHFRKLMRLYEQFCGVRILSYCLMSNHYHLLVEVPTKSEEELDDEALLSRLSLIYSDLQVKELQGELAKHRADGNLKTVKEVHARYNYRFGDLSQFMKVLLQRFTQWYNKKQGRKGTLWEDRFKSVLVEDGYAARVMAAYIDLNPVRAGMVDDPKDYRWSSYGEAIAGGKLAQEGLERVMAEYSGNGGQERLEKSWKEVANQYRLILFGDGEEKKALDTQTLRVKTKRKGIKREAREKEEIKKGKLSRSELLRCRVRYFKDGVVIGSKGFVEDFFEKRPSQFIPNRKTGSCPLRGTSQKELYSLRDLGKT